MAEERVDLTYVRERAEREMALAKATGAKAHVSPDWRTIYIQRPDGTRETVRVPATKPN